MSLAVKAILRTSLPGRACRSLAPSLRRFWPCGHTFVEWGFDLSKDLSAHVCPKHTWDPRWKFPSGHCPTSYLLSRDWWRGLRIDTAKHSTSLFFFEASGDVFRMGLSQSCSRSGAVRQLCSDFAELPQGWWIWHPFKNYLTHLEGPSKCKYAIFNMWPVPQDLQDIWCIVDFGLVVGFKMFFLGWEGHWGIKQANPIQQKMKIWLTLPSHFFGGHLEDHPVIVRG